MRSRQHGHSQETAAAKAGISIRSGRRIDRDEHSVINKPRRWRTREDSLASVWDSELVPLLERESDADSIGQRNTLISTYRDGVLQMKRRPRIHYTETQRALMWDRWQQAEPGLMGLSDFTRPDDAITVAGDPFPHLLYQFRLAYSGWRSVTAVRGGESYAALSEGLQQALRKTGG